MALTIGTLAPLHMSPLQQLSSHLVIFVDGSVTKDLQLSELQTSDRVEQPLA